MKIVCTTVKSKYNTPDAKHPCTTHAPIPCRARLARRPRPKSDPTKPRDIRTTWYCCYTTNSEQENCHDNVKDHYEGMAGVSFQKLLLNIVNLCLYLWKSENIKELVRLNLIRYELFKRCERSTEIKMNKLRKELKRSQRRDRIKLL